MEYYQLFLEFYTMLESHFDCYLVVTDEDSQDYYDFDDSIYYLGSDLVINPDIKNKLPCDVTDILLELCKSYDLSFDDLIDILSTIIISVQDIGIKDRLGYLTFNFIFTVENSRYYLTDIQLSF